MSKEIEKREQKVPKTIQVKTVIISVAMLITVVASFMGGWFGHIEYTYKVQSDAAQLVDKLSKTTSR